MTKLRIFSQLDQSAYTPPIWLAVLIALAFILVGSFLGGLALVPIGYLIGLVFSFVSPDGSRGTTFELYGHYMLFFQLGLFFFMALVVFFWVKFIEKRPFAGLGFFKEKWYLELGRGFLFGVLQFSLVVGLILLLGGGQLELAQLTLEPFLFILALIPFWLLQGGTEELITRIWLFPTVSKKSNLLLGAVISSLLFSLMHLFNGGISILPIINIFLVGLFACLLLIKYDNIWVLAGWHGAWNFVQGNVYGIQVSGQEASSSFFNFLPQSSAAWLTGGEFGAEGSLLTTLVLLASLVYLYLSLDKAGKLPQDLKLAK